MARNNLLGFGWSKAAEGSLLSAGVLGRDLLLATGHQSKEEDWCCITVEDGASWGDDNLPQALIVPSPLAL